MELGSILTILVSVLLLGVAGRMIMQAFSIQNRGQAEVRSLMARSHESDLKRRMANAALEGELSEIDKKVREAVEKSGRRETLEEMMFQAGVFSELERNKFLRYKVLGPFLGPVFGAAFAYITVGFNGMIGWALPVMGAAVGYRFPYIVVDGRRKERFEEIMFYLPIVIEQMVIGVSSSLDIGPCIQKICEMSKERDRTNAVIQLLEQSQIYVRSGNSLEEAVTQIGVLSGHMELKHAFNAIAQVSRHGGEVTKQLQELADAVTVQREAQIEAKIKKLELSATGPVALAFLAFMIVLGTGIACRMANVF